MVAAAAPPHRWRALLPWHGRLRWWGFRIDIYFEGGWACSSGSPDPLCPSLVLQRCAHKRQRPLEEAPTAFFLLRPLLPSGQRVSEAEGVGWGVQYMGTEGELTAW